MTPWTVVRRDTVASTNDVAKELLAEGADPGTVVVAAKQVAGRGRHGRRWVSPRGGLYVSVLLRESLDRVSLLALAGSLAVRDALQSLGLVGTLKWPNDVRVGGRKVAGILVEGLVAADAYWAVVGVGVNSDVPLERLSPDLEEPATTIRHELRERVDNDALLEAFLAALGDRYPQEDAADLVAAYRSACESLGREVTVETAQGVLRGRAVDVNDQGFLVLETPDGERVEVAQGTLRHLS